MKIAFFVEAFPQLSETFILDQVQACVDRGYDVTVFTASHVRRQATTGDARAEELASLVAEPSRGASPTRVKAIAKLLALSKRYGIINIRQCVSFVANQAPQHFDVIHAHFAPGGRRAALLKKAGYLTGRLITTFHGFDLHTIPRRYPLSYYKPVFEESSRITCGSTFMIELASWMGAPNDKLSKIPMGVDLQRFSFFDRSTPNSSQPLNLLSVGRLVEFKGHSLGLRAVAKAAQNLDLRYTIAGDGQLRPQLEREITELGIADIVTLTGPRTRDEIQSLLNESDALLHPAVQASNGSVESQGVVLAEAAATGLPIIATRSGGIPDSVHDQRNGYLVTPNDVDALGDAIIDFAKDSSRWSELRRESRVIAEEYFNAERLQQEFFNLYERS